MAVKGKITINDIQYVQLDADPTVTATDSPLGTMAVYVSGVNFGLYLKVATGTDINLAWKRLDLGWRQTGDNVNQDRIMGPRNDFALSLIRNNNRLVILGKQAEAGFLDNTVELFFDAAKGRGRLAFRSYSGNDEQLLNYSEVISTTHYPMGASERQNRSIILESQGSIARVMFARDIVAQYGSSFSESSDFSRMEFTMSVADKNINSTGTGSFSRIVGGLHREALEMAMIEIDIMIKRSSDNALMSVKKMTVSAKLLSGATRNYQLMATPQDDYTANESATPMFQINMVASTHATQYDPAFTGASSIQVVVSNLSPSVTYDYVMFARVKGVEL